MVERSLRMREARGSIPRVSILFFNIFKFLLLLIPSRIFFLFCVSLANHLIKQLYVIFFKTYIFI
jgi:hypothetical protein